MSAIKYSDNVLVQHHAGEHPYNEYLSIHFAELGEDSEWPRWTVSLTRYIVPGRVDVYNFDFTPGASGEGSRIRFFTDTQETMAHALKLVQRDLKRRQVVRLLMEAAEKNLRWHRDLVHLMENISPGSRAASIFKNASDRSRKRILYYRKLREKMAAKTAQPSTTETDGKWG